MSTLADFPAAVVLSASPEAVGAWLRETVSELLGVAPSDIDMTVRFRELGLASAQVTALIARLSHHIGLPLSPTTALAGNFPSSTAG